MFSSFIFCHNKNPESFCLTFGVHIIFDNTPRFDGEVKPKSLSLQYELQ